MLSGHILIILPRANTSCEVNTGTTQLLAIYWV